jgi:hypothetical protein
MTAAEILAEARRRGVELQPRGDRIACVGPAAALDERFLAALAAQRPAVLRLLARAAAPARVGPPALDPPGWADSRPRRWRCTGPFCRHRSRWWRSVHNVILCRNCVQPAFPWLVAAEGGPDDDPYRNAPGPTRPFETGPAPHRAVPRSGENRPASDMP